MFKKNIIALVVIISLIGFVIFGFWFYFKRKVVTLPPAEVNVPIETKQEEIVLPPADQDGDGLTDDEEQKLGTDFKNSDTDSDGLKDGAEVKLGHDPKIADFNLGDADSDKDGLKDSEENFFKTDPNKEDTDEDGISDFVEISAGRDPLKAESRPTVEIRILQDADGDKLVDEDESFFGTDFRKADTDSDELNDYEEVRIYLTDPLNSDTDGDGYPDGTEVKAGYNPLGTGQL